MWTVPVTMKASMAPAARPSRVPRTSLEARGARAGDTWFASAKAPPARSRSRRPTPVGQAGSATISRLSSPGTRITDKQRAPRARARWSNSPGFPGEPGRNPRPHTRRRAPTGSADGGPSTITTALPLTGRQDSPSRTAATARRHSLVGGRLPPRSGSAERGNSRGDSSSDPSTTSGTGRSPSDQARSSAGNSLHCAEVHAALLEATATSRSRPAAVEPPPASTVQASKAPSATPQHASAGRGRRIASAVPTASAAATTTSGRVGSGSRRHHPAGIGGRRAIAAAQSRDTRPTRLLTPSGSGGIDRPH